MSNYGDFEREQMRREMEYVGRDMEEPWWEEFTRCALWFVVVSLVAVNLIFGLDKVNEYGRKHIKQQGDKQTWSTKN